VKDCASQEIFLLIKYFLHVVGFVWFAQSFFITNVNKIEFSKVLRMKFIHRSRSAIKNIKADSGFMVL